MGGVEGIDCARPLLGGSHARTQGSPAPRLPHDRARLGSARASRPAGVFAIPGRVPARRRARERPRRPHDARGEGVPDGQPHARHPAAGRARVQPVVGGAARRRRRRLRDGVPAGDRALRHLRRALARADGGRDRARGARQVQPGREGRPRRPHDGRADVLLAQHQHLPRPALGPRAGDLRRGSLPRGSARRRVHQGHAGRRPGSPRRHGHREALRGALRPGAPAPRLRREGVGARHRGHVPPRLPRGGRRGQGEVRHVRVQRDQRRARLRQRAPAGRHAARAVEVRRLRHGRLRRRPGRRDGPQVREVRRGGRRLRGQGRPRQRLHHQRVLRPGRGARLPALRRRGEAGPADRGGDRRGPEAHAAPALRAGALRSAGPGEGGAGAGLGARQPRAPRARAEARPRVAGAAEERRGAAVREGAGADRRRGAAGRQQPRAAGQLQRLALALDDGARGNPEAVPEGARRVRAGHDVPAPRRTRADLGAHHPRGRPRPRGRGVREARLQRHAGRDADGPAGPRRTRPRRRSAAELRRAASGPGAPDALDAASSRPPRAAPTASASRDGATACSSTTGSWSTRPAASRRPRASSTSRSRRDAATRSGSSRSRAGSPPRGSCGRRRSRTSRAAPSPRRGPRTSSSPSSASRPTSRARRTASTSPASRAATAPASTCRRRSSSCSRP